MNFKRSLAFLLFAASLPPRAAFAEDSLPLKRGVFARAETGCNSPESYAAYNSLLTFAGDDFHASAVVYTIKSVAASGAAYKVKVHALPNGGLGYPGKAKDIVWTLDAKTPDAFTLVDPDPDGARGGVYRWCAAKIDDLLNSSSAREASPPTAPSERARLSVIGPRYDALHGVYDGEQGEVFDHNGSWVQIFRRAGLIVYASPKASIAEVVRKGDILFRGGIGAGPVSGTAYVFKSGCRPEPYPVKGGVLRKDPDARLVLRGAAPVRERDGCAVVGYSATSGNAVLAFKGQGEFGD